MMRAQPRWLHCALLLAGLAGWPLAATARVVINEIYYHAPDGIEDLQYIELHNNGDEEVNLGSWSFTKGIQFKFPPGTILEPNGFLVICRNRERFKEYFDVP